MLALERVASTAEAFTRVNASRFGLQAGVFTHDIGTAFLAHRELEVGGVMVGESRPLTSPRPSGTSYVLAAIATATHDVPRRGGGVADGRMLA